MRQVPRYLLIGNGRAARHFQHYLSLLHLPYLSWHRSEPIDLLKQHLKHSSHILLLINDEAVDDFIEKYLAGDPRPKIHFSGSLVSQYAYGAHPLMTFSNEIYTLEQYQKIPFVIDDDAPRFEAILPGLLNQHVRLPKDQKAKYHALCVMSGNFSCLLWQKFFSSLENEFHFPHDILHPYLEQQTQNLLHDFKSALTGPLVRNDVATIEKNIAALDKDPFQEVYKSFVSCYQQIKADGSV